MTREGLYYPEDMIAKLVSFDTVSAKSNLALIDFVEDYLAAHGVEARRVPSEDGKKANLYATIGPKVAGGVVLSGHTDVVPVANQTWSHDPFTVVEKDGRLYGRGTADMKGFVGIALAMVPAFKAADLKVPIHLALSYDEEVGCTGCVDMVAELAAGGIPSPRAVLIGEPTDMRLVVAHKGVNAFSTKITGREAHSSQPHRGANAVLAAGRLITRIGEMAEAAGRRAPEGNGFEPPYTTFSVGRISGGHTLNIIPGECRFLWECRDLPGEDVEEILAAFSRFAQDEVLPTLRATAPEAEIVTKRLAAVTPLRAEKEDDAHAEALVRTITGENARGVVSYTTEGGIFQRHGFSTVVIGPGSIDQAHQPDEFLERDQIEACVAFMHGLADWAARGAD